MRLMWNPNHFINYMIYCVFPMSGIMSILSHLFVCYSMFIENLLILQERKFKFKNGHLTKVTQLINGRARI